MPHTERPNLDVLDLPQTRYDAADWPIAAGLPQFSSTLPDGSPVADASAETWSKLVEPLVSEGFDAVEVPSGWLRLADMTVDRRHEFFTILKENGLSVPGISVARESIIDPKRSAENLDFHHRTIDVAAEQGVPYVCFGLHDRLTDAQARALWFWTEPGAPKPKDDATYRKAVAGFRELGRHAAEVGVDVTLEMYEDTYLGSADEATTFIEDIDHDSVGLNADLGNLIRLHRRVDSWEYMASKVLPYTNYWHIKNYTRTEDLSSGLIVTAPAPLELGVVNYRKAVRYAIAHGFDGPFIVEHYGGDGIGVAATNRKYLRRILP